MSYRTLNAPIGPAEQTHRKCLCALLDRPPVTFQLCVGKLLFPLVQPCDAQIVRRVPWQAMRYAEAALLKFQFGQCTAPSSAAPC